jgi:hypothetical protein
MIRDTNLFTGRQLAPKDSLMSACLSFLTLFSSGGLVSFMSCPPPRTSRNDEVSSLVTSQVMGSADVRRRLFPTPTRTPRAPNKPIKHERHEHVIAGHGSSLLVFRSSPCSKFCCLENSWLATLEDMHTFVIIR